MDPLSCSWDTATLLVFSKNVFDSLIYYSHFSALILSVGFGLFVFLNNRKSLIHQVLFTITLFLSAWLFSDLVLWATEKSEITMTFWSFTILFEPIVYAFALYFVYLFIDKKDISLRKKITIFAPLLITIFLAPTTYALLGFDLTSCDRDAIEGPLVYYGYSLEILYTLWIIFLAFSRCAVEKVTTERKKIGLMATGTVLFLLSFAFGNIIGSLFTNANFIGEDYSWTIGQYGLFGVPVFVGFLAYLIIKFKAFNIKLIGAQALVFTLALITACQFFYATSYLNIILIAITLILILVFGSFLVRSVIGEIKSREHLQMLTDQLQRVNNELSSANTKLKLLDQQKTEFISFATHQLRSPLTAIRGTASLILEGDLGKVPKNLMMPIETIFTSINTQIRIVEDYLNVSRIELGTMNYSPMKVDLKNMLSDVMVELRPNFSEKSLISQMKFDDSVEYTANVDIDKFKQVLMNVIDNSIKYTPSGSITASLEKDDQRGVIRIKIEDTGVGIKPEVLPKLFQKFTRAPHASEVNIHGTGLGLYLAKEITLGHNGRIWAESDGEGKGSRFFVEVPSCK